MSFPPWDPRITHDPNFSNLDSFIDFITPIVPAQLITKKCDSSNGCLVPNEDEMVKCYGLEDFWDSCAEWSAYGAGVPIVIGHDDTVMQYYNPSLSAMQIFTNKSFRPNKRNTYGKKVENNNEYSQSDDSASDKISKSLDNSSSASIDSTTNNAVASIVDAPVNQFGHLYMQYNEIISPYDRVPFVQKIKELSKTYPGLQQFKSVDLTPYSWIAISWYPIYHVSAAKRVKGLAASFLTYHQLSYPSGGAAEREENVEKIRGKSKKDNEIALPPFAMSTYKLGGPLWLKPEVKDQEKRLAYEATAFSWLGQLNFKHNDFNFFVSRRF